MSFYLRKSVKAGPFRFNLSKSGVGVSAGVKGFRVGTGPRGNYVHMGRGGLYFRKSLNPAGARPTKPSVPIPTISQRTTEMEEIESGSVLKMVDSSSAALLAEINEKAKKVRLFRIVLVVIAFLLLFILSLPESLWAPLLIVLTVIAALALIAAKYRDDIVRSVVILYDLEPEIERAYGGLHSAFKQFANSARTWHIPSAGNVRDRKYHAGASRLVDRKQVHVSYSLPSFVKTNVQVPVLTAGRQQLAFMPDRLLVFDGTAVGAVDYRSLQIVADAVRFVEDEGVPPDAQVVDHTWQYVNKNGTRDRRFKHNRQLPVALYEDVHFKSASGLNELFKVSRVGTGRHLQESIRNLADMVRESENVTTREAPVPVHLSPPTTADGDHSGAEITAAIKFIKDGDKERGRRLLLKVLNANPSDERAWLWLASVVQGERRQFALKRVLELNPGNSTARHEMAKLTRSVD